MKIGVFDSGLGGLSVLQHLTVTLPAADFIYIADSANAPYGTKQDDFIADRSLQISQYLLQQEVSAIVIACNTATAAAVQHIREQCPVPVVAIEPALKPASLQSQTGRIGVLATASTLNSTRYQQLARQFTRQVTCYQQAANGLVEQVEAGALDSRETIRLLENYLQPMLENDVDQLVLGCTHYPFLLPAIRAITGDVVTIIDTGKAVSEQLARVLQEQGINSTEQTCDHVYLTSGDPLQAKTVAGKLLGEVAGFSKLPV